LQGAISHNFVALSLNYRNVRALVDSGAEKSCISEEFLKRLRMKPEPLSPDESTCLYSANKSEIRKRGTVELNVAIQGLVIPFRFYVLQGLSYNCILGIDFLTDAQATIDCNQRLLSLYQGLAVAPLIHNMDKESILCMADTVTIPPRTEALVPVTIHPKYVHRINIVEAWPEVKNKMIAVAGALIFPRSRQTVCRVMNIGLTPRTLRKKTPVAIRSDIDTRNPCIIAMNSHATGNAAHQQNEDQNELPTHEQRLQALLSLGLPLKRDDLTEEQFSQLTALLYRFRRIFATELSQLPGTNLMEYEIHLTDTRPIRVKQFKHPPQVERELIRQCEEMEKAGIIEPTTSPFNSATFLVKKHDNSFRMVTDLRPINARILPEFFALPSITDVIQEVGLARARYFTICDAKSGFYQLKLAESSRPYTAFTVGGRRWMYSKVPMGLRSSPLYYNLLMGRLFQSELLSGHMTSYLDDSVFYHETFEEHLRFMEQVCRRFDEANLRLHPKKCFFATSSLTFLGFELSRDGIRIDKSRFQALENYPEPARTTVIQVTYLSIFRLGHFSI
jgi:hypothetical protein